MTWLLYLAFFVQGAVVSFLAYRIDKLEQRCQHLTVSARHAYDASEMLADSLGGIRKTLADHAVELTDLTHEVERARGGDAQPYPWHNRGGLN